MFHIANYVRFLPLSWASMLPDYSPRKYHGANSALLKISPGRAGLAWYGVSHMKFYTKYGIQALTKLCSREDLARREAGLGLDAGFSRHECRSLYGLESLSPVIDGEALAICDAEGKCICGLRP